MTNKRGDNLMVSYVLLIVIAIALSAGVFSFLKLRTPSDRAECPPDISLTIEEAQCNRAGNIVTMRLYNRGLFNVSGAFIRFGEADKSVRTQINKDREYLRPENSPNSLGLPPGVSTPLLSYHVGNLAELPENEELVIEVQPAIFKNRVFVPCANKIAVQPVDC